MYQANLDEFRSTRTATLRLAAGLTDQQASFIPAPGKWSAGEVLDHLLLGEQLYRDKFTKMIAMQKAGQKAEIRSSFREINTSLLYIPRGVLPLLEVPFRLMNLFVPAAVRETLTRYRVMPAQAASIATPRPGRSLAELRAALESSWRQTEELFQSNPDLDYRQMRLSHPLMGDNDALQLLRIMTLHEQRHQQQIRTIMRSPRFPPSS